MNWSEGSEGRMSRKEGTKKEAKRSEAKDVKEGRMDGRTEGTKKEVK